MGYSLQMRMGGGTATRFVAEHGSAVYIRLRADRECPAESALENDDHSKAGRPAGMAWPHMDNHGDDIQAAQAPAFPAGGVLMDEIWKPIPDTDYAVSNTGKVASMKKGWRVLKQALASGGYPFVSICSKGTHGCKVHSLVAEAFLGPRPTAAHQVNHKNGVKVDNHAENLEWVTSQENIRHRFDVLGHVGLRGEKAGGAKVTEVEVREIRKRRAAGERLKDIAADYGIGFANVSSIALGKNWAWLK